MNKEEIAFLQGLLETPSPTGCEEPVAQLVRERLAGTADEIATDTMGTVTARLEGRGAGPALMLAAHMDEVGLMVTYISDEGFLSVAMVGGVDAAVLPGMRVDVHTEGGVLRGVVGRKPIHLISPDERKNVTPMDKLVIDLGLPADQVKERVRIGDEITYGVGFELFGEGMAVSRAFDDKCGVYVAARVLENLAEAGRAEGAFIAAATVQEEIGTRGAITCAHAVNPDVALAFDVTHATDYPGIEKSKYGSITCGEGPVIARGPNINPVVFRRLVAAAEAEGIPYQLEAEPSVTGTDARAIQVTRGGIPTGLISVPLRYMHTPTEVVCLEDLDNTVKLITRFALDLHGDLSFVPGMGDGTGEKVSAGEQIEDSERAAAESEAARMDDVMESLDREVRAIEDFISSEE
ncbi:M42 family metallopeptidase [Parvibacter caecicola]|uniref:M42 family metallopeptidase n=1 Tax=Parvibacter caecicola TaxID=747645 RepID=UPI0023F43804|nr:M42 family metallopeptidase [Parvibacter caecicola]